MLGERDRRWDRPHIGDMALRRCGADRPHTGDMALAALCARLLLRGERDRRSRLPGDRPLTGEMLGTVADWKAVEAFLEFWMAAANESNGFDCVRDPSPTPSFPVGGTSWFIRMPLPHKATGEMP